MTTTSEAETAEYSTGKAKAHFCELVRRTELTGEEIVLTRRGRPVAKIVPIQTEPREAAREDWVLRVAGMLDDAPEVLEAIDGVYRSRQNDTFRPLHFAWDEEA
ncbi:type II toxin-antitoxin system prevent-host-death family antitoxin [bacterium]|nr:type II toxin-antitoxin system prevent-host-death family antitoxin [bacterium]